MKRNSARQSANLAGRVILGDCAVTIMPPERDSTSKTSYPFSAPHREVELALQSIPTADLRAEIEAIQWLALNVAGDNRAVAELQLEALVSELEPRKRLWERSASDPLRPSWPRRDTALRARVEAIKAAWPIDRFCTELLGIQPSSHGRERWKASCPLPGHDDRTASFTVYEANNSAWCFGCNRGGDVITLTGYIFGLERFYDRLERLEGESGIGNRGAA